MTSPGSPLTDLDQVRDLARASGLDPDALTEIVADALAEDLGGRGVLPGGVGAGVDLTSVATVEAEARASGEFVVHAPGVLAGGPVAAYVMASVCSEAGPFQITIAISDGTRVTPGDRVMRATGNARALLRAERVALNLLTLMSGTATATAAWVEALSGTATVVRDSRKTVPGLRMLQKYAVAIAGGINHRQSLADAALIKDNHVLAAGGVVPAYRAVRAAFPTVGVQVEVTSHQQARDVVAAGADDILLDNMGVGQMAAVVAELGGRARFEASGGLTLAGALEIARTGVDSIAVGAITHSAPSLDIGFDFAD